MNPHHVIILAQGQQARLPRLLVPKQLLALKACQFTNRAARATILERTLCQLALLGYETITVVCGGALKAAVEVIVPAVYSQTGQAPHVLAHELADPGNSSLKGIHRYLTTSGNALAAESDGFQNVVLLGDVVYSWECLRKISEGTHWGMGFVGSPDLSRSGGELYGISWRAGAHVTMMELLERAMRRHPPHDRVYQCGQLRRWLWEADMLCAAGEYGESYFGELAAVTRSGAKPAAWTPAGLPRTWFTVCDDYTDDVDVPDDVKGLDDLSTLAALDDENNGLRWGP